MSNTDPKSGPQSQDEENRAPQGPNLVIAYGLMALALLIAIVVAVLIVWPFYKAR
jgi:hypothetical protein